MEGTINNFFSSFEKKKNNNNNTLEEKRVVPTVLNKVNEILVPSLESAYIYSYVSFYKHNLMRKGTLIKEMQIVSRLTSNFTNNQGYECYYRDEKE
ncbi:hypothetical protein CICLE_v10010028mg [Citrus x clementina]|uniref:Uncharacterized protein n=1 Tax=Citrus clementina TaxID=85681 RepID=V4UJW5_CITCL|nr:hypothetical protein CICLE_v10010028mg [Citrus x clementina]